MTNDETNSDDEMTTRVSDAVGALLAEVEGDIAARKPVCVASGRCCKFEAYGHRLYVTGAEVLHFAAVEKRRGQGDTVTRGQGEGRSVSLGQFFSLEKQEGCPYQVGGLCTAREGRPLGCRIYFCDENAQSWQNEVYEKYHTRLRGIHEEFGLPYRYVEWRVGLWELAEGGGALNHRVTEAQRTHGGGLILCGVVLVFCARAVGDDVGVKNVDKALDVEVSVEWKGERLDKVVAELREKTGTNLVVNWAALSAAGVERASKVTLKLKDVPYEAVVRSVLLNVGGGGGGLNYVVGGNAVEVTTNAELGNGPVERLHDVAAVLKKNGGGDAATALTEILRTALVGAGERVAKERALVVKDGMLAATVSMRGQAIVEKMLAMLAAPVRGGVGAVAPGAVESVRAKKSGEALKKWMDGSGKLPLKDMMAEGERRELNVLVLPGARAGLATAGGATLDYLVDDAGIVEIGTREEIAARVVPGVYDLSELAKRRSVRSKGAAKDEVAKMVAELKAGEVGVSMMAYGAELIVFAPAATHREIAAKLREMYNGR